MKTHKETKIIPLPNGVLVSIHEEDVGRAITMTLFMPELDSRYSKYCAGERLIQLSKKHMGNLKDLPVVVRADTHTLGLHPLVLRACLNLPDQYHIKGQIFMSSVLEELYALTRHVTKIEFNEVGSV